MSQIIVPSRKLWTPPQKQRGYVVLDAYQSGGGGGGGGTDDFSSNTMSSYTQYADSSANWAISGGHLTASSGNQSILTRNGVSFANGEVSCVIKEAEDSGLVLRLQNNSTYYLAVIADDSCSVIGARNSVVLYSRIGGSYTNISGQFGIPTFTRGAATHMAFSASGNTLYVKVNGTTYITMTDSSIPSSGKCGVRMGAPGAHKFDSFTWP